MICACSLAGTAACASCSNNPNKANQYGVNFITWTNNTERTCKIEYVKKGTLYDVWRCSSCGYEYAESVREPTIILNYCPNCGVKVKDE